MMISGKVVQCNNDFDTGMFIINTQNKNVTGKLILRNGKKEFIKTFTLTPFEIKPVMMNSLKQEIPENMRADQYIAATEGEISIEAVWNNNNTSNFFYGFPVPSSL